MISEPMVPSAQTVHLACVKISTLSKTNCIELPLERCHLRVPLGASKMILKAMTCLAQTVHLYCTDTNNVSKHAPLLHKNDFRASSMFGPNRASILRQD
jgi:hypothetical protein